MELKHIDIANLSVSSANMRGVAKKPDLTNILPSVRARGILVPLIVRPGTEDGSYEIVAGKRRYHAALAVAAEGGGINELPCAVMEAGDDAAALEASLIENIARLDPDEVNRCEAFTRLVREGRSVEAVGLTFGLTSLQVKRTLAIGNLLPRMPSSGRRCGGSMLNDSARRAMPSPRASKCRRARRRSMRSAGTCSPRSASMLKRPPWSAAMTAIMVLRACSSAWRRCPMKR